MGRDARVGSAALPREHPAAEAWARLGARTPPLSIQTLKHCGKSATYRLAGARPGGGSLIAKRARRETALVEHRIYAEILPGIPLPGLAFHGFLDDDEDGFCWLFMDDAGDAEPRAADEVDPVATARWLATLHSGAAGLAATRELPDRGVDHHLGRLRRVREAIAHNHDNPAFDESARRTLDSIRSQCDLAESRWSEVEELCNALPRTLVHGDFVRKNVRIGPHAQQLLVFDWEFAGQGIPAVDFCASESSRVPLRVDARAYLEVVRSRWPRLDRATLERMHAIGLLFRWGIVAVEWRSYRLAYPWVDRVIADLRVYRRRTERGLRALGWMD